MQNRDYNNQVFINCPFDVQYLDMFRACTFVILDAGFIPRCSKEIIDGTQFRLAAIVKIIRSCRYGIHDLSRVELDPQSQLPWFNMPFELGVYYAAKHFGNNTQKRKSCLVLEKCKYRYQKYISDIAGIDVTPHQNTQRRLILAIRDWLVTASRRTTIPPGLDIYNRFKIFQAGMRSACRKRSIDYNTIPFVELVNNMTDWLRVNQTVHVPIFGPWD